MSFWQKIVVLCVLCFATGVSAGYHVGVWAATPDQPPGAVSQATAE